MKHALRAPTRRALSAWLRLRARPLVLDGAPLLVVAPHPDDETLGCGGLIFRRRMSGLPVHVIWLTDGSASHDGHPLLTSHRLAEIRRGEARLASSLLGIDPSDTAFLGLPDGRLPRLTAEERVTAVAALALHIGNIRPGSVLLPSEQDGSDEHAAAFSLVRAALDGMGLSPRLLAFPVWALWSPRLLSRLALGRQAVFSVDFPGYEPVKRRAIGAHASQFLPSPPWPHAVTPSGFADVFSTGREYFFECRK